MEPVASGSSPQSTLAGLEDLRFFALRAPGRLATTVPIPRLVRRRVFLPSPRFRPQAQIARLKYVLAAGVKELLADRVADWPGIHSATALLTGEPLVGRWLNRTKECAARHLCGEEDVEAMGYATEERLVLSPLPCRAYLPGAEYRLLGGVDEVFDLFCVFRW